MTLKDFYHRLNDILTDYSSNELERNKAENELEDLMCDAEDANLDVNISLDLIDEIVIMHKYDDWNTSY